MLSIRLSRVGKRNQPSYRLIVLEKSKDPWGNYLENLGFYNPLAKPKIIQLKPERIKYWLGVGAKPSPTAHNLLVNQGVIPGPKIKAAKVRKKLEEKTEEPSETKAAAEVGAEAEAEAGAEAEAETKEAGAPSQSVEKTEGEAETEAPEKPVL